MAVDGIWTGEVYSPFGWESRGIYAMEKGRIIGGDHRQYTTGRYTIDGDTFSATVDIHYYGPPRTTFGEKTEQYTAKIEGNVAEGVMEGLIWRPDKDQYQQQFRMTKRMALPTPLSGAHDPA